MTLSCLEHFYACDIPQNHEYDIYLVDDQSPDETGRLVKERWPQIRVIRGTGNLYWCGGMRLAWNTATQNKEYDAFLWLNDDTFLFKDALYVFAQAIAFSESKSMDVGIVVGAVCDSETQKTTYGVTGNPPRSPDGCLSSVENETINGNIVWVSRVTWQKIGGFRNCFTHAMGDTDYGIRAMKTGIPIWLTPIHIGSCQSNQGEEWSVSAVSLARRWKLLHSVKGCPPKEFLQLVRVAHPFVWPIFMCKLYYRVLFPRKSFVDKGG
jgi:Predicted glycosyltransferases